MKKLVIITPSYMNSATGELKIGGLETYIKLLASLGVDNGYKVIIYQYDNVNKIIKANYDNTEVISLPISKLSNQKVFEDAYAKHNSEKTKFVIATDQLGIKSKSKNVIAIQHGIAFDIPGYMIKGFWSKNKVLHHINKMLRCIKNIQRFYMIPNTVCVDYNYYNWLRTLGTIYKGKKVVVIPNCTSSFISETELDEKLNKKSKVRKIVFARRFVDYRGTILFANIVNRILNRFENVEITFAGNGPLESLLKERFANNKRIKFTSFSAEESVSFHKDYDIAVVPTIFSEGTSLSLCEAMAAGCLGISTHVGGLTNIIIDHHNGFMCAPSEDELFKTVEYALELNDKDFSRIVRNGYNTTKEALSLSIWNRRWLNVLEK